MPSIADHPTINVPPVAVQRPPLALSVPALPAELPGDVAGLVALLESQQQAFQEALQTAVAQVAHTICAQATQAATLAATRAAHAYLIRMIEQAKLARHRLYGASSEQAAQGHLFDEAEALAQQSSAAQDTAPLPPAAADAGRQPAGRLGRGHRRA
ncbi:MAG: hypothetical protein ABW202_23615, partial [Duganella sp.]